MKQKEKKHSSYVLYYLDNRNARLLKNGHKT